MAVFDGTDEAQAGLMDVARHCIQAAMRAPSVTGRLGLKTGLITGEDILDIVEVLEVFAGDEAMMRMDCTTLRKAFDAGTPPVVVLLGADLTRSELNWDCGACGFGTCGEFNAYSKKNRGMGAVFEGPSCVWKVLDFGMACDWACAAAYQCRVDNRIEMTIGAVAWLLQHLPGSSAICGLPLGPCCEHWWYSRPAVQDEFTFEEWRDMHHQMAPHLYQAFPGGAKPRVKTSADWWNSRQVMKILEDAEAEDAEAENRAAVLRKVIEKNVERQERGKDAGPV